MGCRRAHQGLPLGAIAVAVALLGVPSSAEASSPCSRYGDQRPGKITAKHARTAVICLINRERGQHNRGRLDHDGRLDRAARSHSARMATKGCFSHKCGGERDLEGRLRAVGYLEKGLRRWAYGENIAYGEGTRGTPRQIVNAWMNSSGHRANILSGSFRDVGVGYARRGDRGYYTADFGLRQG